MDFPICCILGQFCGANQIGFLPLKGDANHKSSDLYENLPVQTKMAILSKRPILLAILTQINLHPDRQLLITKQHT